MANERIRQGEAVVAVLRNEKDGKTTLEAGKEKNDGER